MTTATDRTAPRRAALGALLAAGLLAACSSVPPPGGRSGPALPGAPPTPGGAAPSTPALGFLSRINVPAGHRPALRLTARGVQVFRCEARGNDSQWVFRVPEADLADDSGKVVARHGADFSFEHSDGSRLIGKVASFDEAPSRDDLRWLLLTTTSYGQGSFAGVRFVQRTHTKGGMPPASCAARERNQLLRVPFTAEFMFYKPG
ncbi:MAG: DUF3455 domain-containing protein [Burkholderiales bacterium]|nr:DUF3455 domain-containing protein [Burkholderiales bacterium]MCA3229584.1 DUF3455 domain-containing protein [Burkholderiales bacterium]